MEENLAGGKSVYHECPINFSGFEGSSYVNICRQCGGYQRYHCYLSPPPPVIPANKEDDSPELLFIDPTAPAHQGERTRMKLSFYQKEMMRGYADMLQWSIEGHDEEDLNQFCLEIGVTSEVFKIWLRNSVKTHLYNHGGVDRNSYADKNNHRDGGDGCGIVGSG